VGKRPRGHESGTDQQTELIRLRREMEEAKKKEHYERAAKIRDQIRELEQKVKQLKRSSQSSSSQSSEGQGAA
jgi:protein-arginine kinase activator protein McsA